MKIGVKWGSAMNLSLSRRADYVTKAAIALARSFDGESYMKIRQIAAEMAIPRSYTPQILDALGQVGLVESRAGKSGGYRLTRAPESIRVLEVLEAGEGPLRAETCALSNGPCRWEAVCPIHELMSSAVKGFRETLAGETLAQLAARDIALEKGEIPPPEEPHVRRDSCREFPISQKSEVGRSRLSILSALSDQEGEWLAGLMSEAVLEAYHVAGSEYLLTDGNHKRAVFSVNMGLAHERGSTINIPVTIESVGGHMAPQLIGTFTLSALERNSTEIGLTGRLEFNAVFFNAFGNGSESSAEYLHECLERIATAVSENLLAKISVALLVKAAAD